MSKNSNYTVTPSFIADLVSGIAKPTKFCVEFGARDGRHLLNSFELIHRMGFAGVLVEPNKKKYAHLKANYEGKKSIVCLNQFVGWSGKSSLDHILDAAECPKNFDFLSIDIDGNDYHVWRGLKNYRPKLVCIEFNPTIPAGVRFVQPSDPKVQWGCSVSSLLDLGLKKGYRPIFVGLHDVIFAVKGYDKKKFAKINIPIRSKMLDHLHSHIFVGYDGRILLRGYQNLHWHGIPFCEEEIQVLPQYLQCLPDSMNFIQRFCLVIFRGWRRWRRSWGKGLRRVLGGVGL